MSTPRSNLSPPAPSLLMVNAGSSSLKIAAFSSASGLHRLTSAEITGWGGPHANLERAGQPTLPLESDRAQAFTTALSHLGILSQVRAVGHRIVHPGVELRHHQILSPGVVAQLTQAVALDPSHLPAALTVLAQAQRLFPAARHVACLDTVFHDHMPRPSQLLGIPRRWLDHGVRRLGFHGLSYAYLLQELRRLEGPARAEGRLVFLHLGSGASMAAVHRGQCLDTSMGFTAACGLVMATRPGDLDPGVVTYLGQQEGLDVAALQGMLSSRCGLLGVSGRTGDMRELLRSAATDLPAQEAVQLFIHQARRWLGALVLPMGGLDTVVFTGGIGCHAPEIRSAILADLGFLGLAVDAQANLACAPIISTASSQVQVRVMATDEEQVMAEITLGLLEDPPSAESTA